MVNKLLSAFVVIGLFLLPGVVFAQAPALGSAANFVLFTSVGAVNNTGITHLTGNVGTNTGSSTGFGNVNGVMHDGDGGSGAAAASLLIAYNQLNIAVPTLFPAPLLGNGDTLLPGVYHISSAATLNGKLVLNAQGNPNAVFIFQIQGSFTINASSKVKLINSALACNVFWKVEGMVSMASSVFMRGTIVANNAAINMSPSDTLEGRALSTAGAVSVDGILAYTPIGCGSVLLTGPAAPILASTSRFGIFSANGNVTNTGITHVVGDVGTNVGLTAGFDSAFVTGSIHPIPDDSTAAAAASLPVVYNYLNTLGTDIELLYPAQFGNELTLTPHTYLMASAPSFNGNVHLDAQGNSNAVFVIKINGALSTGTFAKVILLNGTQAKNVYWKVDGAVDINNNSIFNGTIVANNAAINLNPGSTFSGRALATNGVITVNGINLSLPVTPACAAPPINGMRTVCTGATTALTDSIAGVWNSGNIAVATIDSATGVVTGITAGTADITYTSAAGCMSMAVVTVTLSPSLILGPGSVCVGSSITLTDLTPGGTWSSSNPAMATTGSATGVVTGVANGTPTITYTAPNSCIATKSIVVGNYAGVINGPSNVCIGSVIVLTDTVEGGTWSASNGHATVLGGVVTGITGGVDTIFYSVTNLCGTATASKVVTIDTTAQAGVINGASSVCAGSTITLTDTAAGGIWSASNTSATVIGGIVTGVYAGVDTIRYTVINVCGTVTATKTVTVNPLPDEGSISGPGTVCTGSTITLTDFAPGGTWSASNTNASVVGGVVTGVTAGIDTIRYTVTNSCGTATANKTITVNPTPNAGVINGPSNVCVGSTITLTDPAPGGVWTMSNANATNVGGVVTGVTAGIDTARYTVTNLSCTSTATKVITIDTLANAGVVAGPSVVCTGSSITLTDLTPGGTWSASNGNANVVGGIVTGVTAGVDTIRYSITNSCGTSTATKAVTVNTTPNAGVISGPSNVCVGSTITLTDPAPGGVWTMSNANATNVGGVVTGVTGGIDTARYTVTNLSCTSTATMVIIIDTLANAGIIAGPSVVCTGSSITLTDLAAGGTWSTSNGNANVVGGIVTGVTAGVDTLRYTITNACGTNTATKAVTVNATPSAGVISGPSNVCVGSTITLTDPAPGGVWSMSNANATNVGGVVTGVTAGIYTASYTVTNLSCTSTATKVITIDSLANAGVIGGPSKVCTGSSIVLTDAVPGGTWSASNANAAILDGIVIGITAGIDTIIYKVTNTCGTDSATKIITIEATPNAGVINGPSNVCVGSTITLTDTAAGGIWTADNANAAVLGGVVTVIAPGTDTIRYTVTNLGCTATVIKAITIDSVVTAGVITGPSTVCMGSSITLDAFPTGGSWTSSNATATVVDGVVTGIMAGVDTIGYVLSNTCGSSTATHTVTINSAPNAGAIMGSSNVCVGSSTVLTDSVSGGEWSATNANAVVSDGVVFGVSSGVDTILYTVTGICGADTAYKAITVNALPNAGVINGPSTVCTGSSIVLTNDVTGGTWTASNGNTTVTDGIVTGVAAGTDSIIYTINNICGTDTAIKIIDINATPDAGVINGPSNLCAGSSVIFTDTVTGGVWSTTNGNASALGSLITGINAGADTINYMVSSAFCSATARKPITIDPLPDAGILTGPPTVCVGSVAILSDTQTGGTWSSSNANASVTGGTVTGLVPGVDTIMYTVINSCGTNVAALIVTVEAAPMMPVISTRSALVVCRGTRYQNFGAAALPEAGTTYTWSAENAAVWAQGAMHQYSLVDFNESGVANVTLTATSASGSCAKHATATVTVSTDVAQVAQVNYFNNHFVCLPSNESSYQWGYDNISSLDSTILGGEINQDYVNESPDFGNKSYWVMTTAGSCMQKTYYLTPTVVTDVNNATSITIYPNPADNVVNVKINTNNTAAVEVVVYNLVGQKLSTVMATDNKVSVDVAALAAGSYLIICNQEGIKIGGATFIKN